jgi:phosphatidyl-myo-inositol alpha-mannosyltransferase
MKIAFFSTSLPEPVRKPGGVDVHVQRLAERLAGRGHELDMYTFSPPVRTTAYRHIQLRPESLRYNRVARMTVVPLLLNRLNSEADVLHLHGDDWFFVRRRLPTVRTFYGSALWEARTAQRMRRRIHTGIVFPLEILASRLATASYDIAPGTGRAFRTVGTLPPAIDLDVRNGDRSRDPTILFVGTWSGRKRGALLADVFTRMVRPAVPGARLVMVSDHVEPAEGIEHVVRPSDEQLANLMRQAWTLCLPSTYEGFGIPYIEAMAAGAAVVATPNPGSRYVLDGGRAGLLVRDEELGTALLQTLRDAKLRGRLADRGRERVSEFAWERILDLHELAYEDAVRRWSTRRSGGRTPR